MPRTTIPDADSTLITIRHALPATGAGAGVTYRFAAREDLPQIERLLETAGLPVRAVEPFIDTFMVAEREGAVVAVGGIEVHGDTAVLRSVAVEDALRGSGVGRELSVRLIGLGFLHGANDIYLFTADAWRFWEKQGFITISVDDWRRPARASWQYEYVQEHREWAESLGLRTMWMTARQ
jgi:amino-acid N-acetyltransferase